MTISARGEFLQRNRTHLPDLNYDHNEQTYMDMSLLLSFTYNVSSLQFMRMNRRQ
jgi:hypothetical protein